MIIEYKYILKLVIGENISVTNFNVDKRRNRIDDNMLLLKLIATLTKP